LAYTGLNVSLKVAKLKKLFAFVSTESRQGGVSHLEEAPTFREKNTYHGCVIDVYFWISIHPKNVVSGNQKP
jgi:hypothetical protein